LTGIISCLAFSPGSEGLLAAGSYNRTTALYSENNCELLFVLHGQEGGVTQVRLSLALFCYHWQVLKCNQIVNWNMTFICRFSIVCIDGIHLGITSSTVQFFGIILNPHTGKCIPCSMEASPCTVDHGKLCTNVCQVLRFWWVVSGLLCSWFTGHVFKRWKLSLHWWS